MTKDELKLTLKIINHLYGGREHINIGFSGGEPLIFEHFYWFLHEYRKLGKNWTINLFTNGTIPIDKDRIPENIFSKIRISNDKFHQMERKRLNLELCNFDDVCNNVITHDDESKMWLTNKGRGNDILNNYKIKWKRQYCFNSGFSNNHIIVILFGPNKVRFCSENSHCFENKHCFIDYKDIIINGIDHLIMRGAEYGTFHDCMNCSTPCTYFIVELDENGNPIKK